MSQYIIILIKTDEDEKTFLESISKIFPTGVIPPKENQPVLGWVQDPNHNALSFINPISPPLTSGHSYKMRVMTMGKQELAPNQTLTDLEIIAGKYLFGILKASKKYSLILSIDFAQVLERYDLEEKQ